MFQVFKLPTRARDAIPVRLSDGEKFYRAMGGITSAIAGGFSLPTGAATSANQIDGSQVSKIKETIPTDETKSNASYVLTRNDSGYITSIACLIGATTYTKTITRDINNYIDTISNWA